MTRSIAAGVLMLAALVGAPSATAQYADNPLLGSWLHTEPGQPGAPPQAMEITFGANGSYEGQWALPKGIVKLHGQYRIHADGVFDWVYASAELCTAGSACMAYPNYAPDLGLGQVHQCHYQIIGPGLLMIDGTRWSRAG